LTNREKTDKETIVVSRSTESLEEEQLENATGGIIIQEIIRGATVLGKRTASEAGLTNYQSGSRKVRIISDK
jgi:hypothetical protein